MALLALKEKDFSDVDENLFKIIPQIILINKKFILITFLAIIVGLYAVLVNLTYQYESSAQILVKLGRENVRTPLTVEKATVYSNGVKKEDINSYINLLSSDALIKQTIATLGYERFKFEPQPETIWQHIKYYVKSGVRYVKTQVRNLMILAGLKTRMSEDQKVEAFVKKVLKAVLLRDSNVIQLSIRLPDAVLAHDFIQTHIQSYFQAHIKVNNRENIFLAFKEQTGFYEKKLIEKQEEIEDIRNSWNIISPKEQRIKLMSDIQVVKMNIQDQHARRAQLNSEMIQLESLASKTPQRYKMQESYGLDPSSELIKEELAELNIERSKMSKLYTKDSKNWKLLNSRIKQIEELLYKSKQEKISSTVNYQPNPLSEKIIERINFIKVDLAGLDSSIKQSEVYLSRLNKEVEGLNKGTFLLSIKELEYSVLEGKYVRSSTQFEQVKIDIQLDLQNISNVSILSPATLAVEPIAPKKSLLFFVGLVAALIISCGIGIFKEWINDRVNDENDINTIADIKFLGYFSI